MDDKSTEYQRQPWRLSNFMYGTGVTALHQEIEHFYSYILPTPTEYMLRGRAVRRIEDVILSIWPNVHVELFGSFRTGLNLPVSDIDLVVTGYWYTMALYDLENALIARGVTLADTVSVLDKAKVPVVKFTELESQIKFDISFNVVTGIKAAELIKEFMHKFPEMPKLVMVLKQFLTIQGLNEVYTGGISSYALTLMCVSFLQQHNRERQKYSNKSILGMLLLKFLDYYGRKFDYLTYCISVRGDGKCVEKSSMQSMDGHNWQSPLSIEDPITPTNDIGRGSYAALYVKQVFASAFLTLSKMVDLDSSKIVGSTLACIVEVPQSVITYRNWVHFNFQHLTMNNYINANALSYSFEPQFYECSAAIGMNRDQNYTTQNEERGLKLAVKDMSLKKGESSSEI